MQIENSQYKLTAQLIGKVIEDKREKVFLVILDEMLVWRA